MHHNRQNIRAVLTLASLTEQADGNSWYPVANSVAISLVDRYEISEAQAIGVIAALSPRNRWERNIQDADALISAYPRIQNDAKNTYARYELDYVL